MLQIKNIKESAMHFKKTKDLSLMSMLLAVKVILSAFSIRIGEMIKISFGFVPGAAIGFLYGPVVGFITGAMGDIIQYVLMPTGPYFPGFTLTMALSGLVYGLFLYKKKPTITRILLASLTVSVFLFLGLNTLWISMMYGKAYMALLIPRIAKELVLVPIQVPLIYLTLKFVENMQKRR